MEVVMLYYFRELVNTCPYCHSAWQWYYCNVRRISLWRPQPALSTYATYCNKPVSLLLRRLVRFLALTYTPAMYFLIYSV